MSLNSKPVLFAIGGTHGTKGKLVVVACTFVDEGNFNVVVVLQKQLRRVNLLLTAILHFDPLRLDEFLEILVLEILAGPSEDGGLLPVVIPREGGSGGSLGEHTADRGNGNHGTREEFVEHN